jgi:hypothetical protein
MTTSVAANLEAQAPSPADKPKPFTLAPTAVTVDLEGICTRTLFVRCPETTGIGRFTAQNLEDPQLWKYVQANTQGKALRQFDRLLIIAYDESWIAEAIVVRADGMSAVISKPRITSIPPRFENLFQDDTYRVRWYGSGYAVERKGDNHRMTDLVANTAIAERDLARLYPSKIGMS